MFFQSILILLSSILTLPTRAEIVVAFDYQEQSIKNLLTKGKASYSEEFVSPMLKLDLQNVLDNKNGFALCLSYFSSGESSINILLRNNNSEEIKIGIWFDNCLQNGLCKVYLFVDTYSHYLTQEISNGWIFTCFTFDILNQEISFGIANKVLFSQKLDTSQTKVPYDVKDASIWWLNGLLDFTFPEKLTLFNIYNNDKAVDKYTCGEPGDIYAWKVDGWNVEGWKSIDDGQNLTILTSQESTNQACQAKFQVYSLPELNLYNAMKTCENINGNLYFDFDTKFNELVYLEGNKKSKAISVWIPYTDEIEEGVFVDVYSDKIFENIEETFLLGQPNGARSENCLIEFKGMRDFNCVKDCFSLCQIPKTNSQLTLRGLCLASQVETFYTAGNDNGKFIWKGYRLASIQYTDHWFLHNILHNVWAESKAPYDSLLLGTNTWTIHNDKRCSNEVYSANLSLSSCTTDQFNCNDGSCINLEFRCDGSPDCTDDSDEFKCDNLIIDGNYNKDIISDQNKQNIDMFVDIIITHVIVIEDDRNLFRPAFEITFQWQDYRLQFQNLNDKKLNMLKSFEVEQIWEPILILDDVNQFNRDVSIEKEVSVSVMEDARPIYADNSFLYNSYIYFGNSTILRVKMGRSAFFVCSFSMMWNPFDVQKCSIKFSINEGQSQFVNLILRNINNTGTAKIQQFNLHSVHFDSDGNVLYGNVVLDRDITGFLITTAIPTVIANMIGHATNFFGAELFDAAIGVNLTILLVLTTMLVEIATSFAQADGFLMTATWMFVSLLLPFMEVLLQTWREVLKFKEEQVKENERNRSVSSILVRENKVSAEVEALPKWIPELRTSWNQRKINIITLFLEKVKVFSYILFIITFFVIGFIQKGMELNKYVDM